MNQLPDIAFYVARINDLEAELGEVNASLYELLLPYMTDRNACYELLKIVPSGHVSFCIRQKMYELDNQ